MQSQSDLDAWLQKASDLLSGNRIIVDGYRYTAPSLDTGDFGRKDYANQFQWDSCFHAIIWRWIDPQMAQDELLALVSRQVKDGPDAGMIPHCNYWQGGGEWLWNHAERSSITQPPLIAYAANLTMTSTITLTPSLTFTPSLTPTPLILCSVAVLRDPVAVRSRPSAVANALLVAKPNQRMDVLEQRQGDDTRVWFRVTLIFEGLTIQGWVRGDVVTPLTQCPPFVQ